MPDIRIANDRESWIASGNGEDMVLHYRPDDPEAPSVVIPVTMDVLVQMGRMMERLS